MRSREEIALVGRMLFELVSSSSLAEQAAWLPPHPVPPVRMCQTTRFIASKGGGKDLPKTPLGSWADRGTERNRRVSATLSPILSLFLAPSGHLYQKVHQLLAADEQAASSPPPLLPHRRPGPKQPAYGIAASEWLTVLHRVIEQKASLHTVATEYGVSHETIRRIIRAATKEPVQHESQLYNLS
jgi:hypothetical protein